MASLPVPPRQFLAQLREDAELLEQTARDDVEPSLLEWFEVRDDGWRADPARTGPLGDEAVCVEWAFDGVHTIPDSFNGLPATKRPVTVRGCSLISMERDELLVRRYIDWAGLFAQLGLTLNWRVPLAES